jgi:hypothetical protein
MAVNPQFLKAIQRQLQKIAPSAPTPGAPGRPLELPLTRRRQVQDISTQLHGGSSVPEVPPDLEAQAISQDLIKGYLTRMGLTPDDVGPRTVPMPGRIIDPEAAKAAAASGRPLGPGDFRRVRPMVPDPMASPRLGQQLEEFGSSRNLEEIERILKGLPEPDDLGGIATRPPRPGALASILDDFRGLREPTDLRGDLGSTVDTGRRAFIAG